MMRRSLTALFSVCFLLPGICFSQVDPSASKVADKYLNAIKLIDLPEGQKMLSETGWEKPAFNEIPVFTEVSTLFEGMFSTDIAGIQGYKRLIQMKAVSVAGTPLLKRYLLICYKDKRSQKWKVLGFNEGTDIEYWVQKEKQNLNDTEFLPRHPSGKSFFQYNYRRYGYELLRAGKIDQAMEAFQKASQLNKLNPDPDSAVKQNDFDVFIEITNSIIGK
jgi:tetratricopeptide (TPR) repeat protein